MKIGLFYLATGLIFGFTVSLTPNLSFGGTIDLPKTGQTTCYDEDGNVIACDSTGQDGDIQAGVLWPEPRFTDNEDGTITDNLTGLMWLKDAGCFGMRTWQDALDSVADFNSSPGSYSCSGYTGGYNDWVLPNANELESLANAELADLPSWLNGQGFVNVQSTSYWSSTTYAKATDRVWVVLMVDGRLLYIEKAVRLWVWPVRAGQTGSFDKSDILNVTNFINLPRTGQTISYAAGDDGALQRGIPWPEPRFTDNGNGTVTDNLTGLMWLNCIGGGPWQWSLDRVSYHNSYPGAYWCDEYTAGYNDWRLANRTELHSITDFSQYDPALPEGHPFSNAHSVGSWTSTTMAPATDFAWIVDMYYGSIDHDTKSFNCNAWIVRAGVEIPTVTTNEISSITSNNATGGGNVTYDGKASIARGVCWSTSTNPTTANNKTTNGTGTGSFESSITGLTPVTTYHVRAYATNIAGTAYGSDVSFTTDYVTALYVCSDGDCGGKPNCHTTIASAVAASESGSIIKIAKDVTYNGHFTLSGKTLTIQGGWDTSFGDQPGTTKLQGAPTVSNGSLTLQDVNIVP